MFARLAALLLSGVIGGGVLAAPVYTDSNYLFGGSGPDGPAGQILRLTLVDGSTYIASTGTSPIGPEAYAENLGAWSSKLGHIAGNYNYFSGYNGVFDSVSHNFFSFDLSRVPGTVSSATLMLTAYAASFPFIPMRFDLYDVATSLVDLLQDAVGKPNQEIFDDLASGKQYGTLAIFSWPFNQLSVQLNEAAVADINSRQSKYFSIGGATNVIPEPGTLALASIGISCLILLRRHRILDRSQALFKIEP